jgi:hypothetical protein
MSSKKEAHKKKPKPKPEKPQIKAQNERTQVGQESLPVDLDRASLSDGLPELPATQPLRRAQILQMQRTHGNAYVQRFLSERKRQNGFANGNKTDIQKAPPEGAAPAATATDAAAAVPLPPITSRAFYWSVNYKSLQTFVIPRRSFHLRQLAKYCYNSEDVAGELASLNGISPDAQLEPGMRILVTGVKAKPSTRRAGTAFRTAPKVPFGEPDPAGWFAKMGLSSPEEFQGRKIALDMLLNTDFMRIVSILDETHYSDSNEGEVISILKKWSEEKLTTNSMTYPYGGYYFDQLLKKLRWKTKSVSWVTEEISDYYSMMFNHFDRANEIKRLVNLHSMLFAGDTGLKEMSAKDAIVDAAKGLPGAITMTAGAFVSQLPGKWANKAGNWLNKTGKDYLKEVGWDDDMIEMSAGISGMTGMAISALVPGGAAKKLTDFWSKAEKIVSALKKAKDIAEILMNLRNMKDKVQAEIEGILSLITDTEKLVPFILGLDEGESKIADWALKEPSEEATPGGGKGVKGLVSKIKAVVQKVRMVLRPIFKVRERFIEMTQMIGGLILSVPGAEDLLEMALDPKKRNRKNFRKIVRRFSAKLGDMLQGNIEAVREMIEAKIEGIFGKTELITREQVYDQVAIFVKGIITKQDAAIGDILNMLDKDNSGLKEHIIKRLLPDELMGVVDIVNEKFQAIMAQFQPAVTMVKEGLKTIAEGISKTLKKVLVKPITDALLQLSPAEDSKEEKVTLAMLGGQRFDEESQSGAVAKDELGLSHGLERNGSRRSQNVRYQLQNPTAFSHTKNVTKPQTIQRAVDWDSLKTKLIKKFGAQVFETFKFAGGASKEDEKDLQDTLDAVAKLRHREVKGPNKPKLPDSYYYTPKGEGLPTGIKRKGKLSKYVPKLIIKKTKTRPIIELGLFSREIKKKQTEEAEEAHKAVIAALGSDAEELLKGHGAYTRGRKGHGFTTEERDRVDDIGYKTGCHSSDATHPGTVLGHNDPEKRETKAYKAGKPNWIPDHQPPNSIWTYGGAREGIRFYPHSKDESDRQFHLQNDYIREMKKRMKLVGRDKSDWAVGIKSKWFWS